VDVLNLLGREEEAQALIDRFRRYKPNNVQLLLTDSMHHLYHGRSADGLRLAEHAYQLAPTDEVMKIWVSFGLAQTLQLERIADEGADFLKVDALDLLGRREEAFELAFELAREDDLGTLFALYNRADRSQELVDYLEERWPGLDAFAVDYPHNEFGYAVMTEIALAYSRTGNAERFDDALLLVEHAMTNLAGQGIDNFVFISQIESAVDRGLRGYEIFATYTPMFEPLKKDPRFIAAGAVMVNSINIDREALGLEPIGTAKPL
jgi:hypothetical protein